VDFKSLFDIIALAPKLKYLLPEAVSSIEHDMIADFFVVTRYSYSVSECNESRFSAA